MDIEHMINKANISAKGHTQPFLTSSHEQSLSNANDDWAGLSEVEKQLAALLLSQSDGQISVLQAWVDASNGSEHFAAVLEDIGNQYLELSEQILCINSRRRGLRAVK